MKRGRITAILLSMVLAVGMFTGMTLPVQAAEIKAEVRYEDVNDALVGKLLDRNTQIYCGYTSDAFVVVHLESPSGSSILQSVGATTANPLNAIDLIYQMVDSQSRWAEFGVDDTWDGTVEVTRLFLGYGGDSRDIYVKPYIAPPASDPVSSAKDSASTQNATDSHTHTLSWVTTIEPTEGTDGMEEYRCSCGYVEISQKLPANNIYKNELIDLVKNASADGTVEYTTSYWDCCTDAILQEWSRRNDVNIKISFLSKGVRYEFTIPAGTSFDALATDEVHC